MPQKQLQVRSECRRENSRKFMTFFFYFNIRSEFVGVLRGEEGESKFPRRSLMVNMRGRAGILRRIHSRLGIHLRTSYLKYLQINENQILLTFFVLTLKPLGEQVIIMIFDSRSVIVYYYYYFFILKWLRRREWVT